MKLQDIFIGDYPITQYFGGNAAAYAQFGLKGHNGVDWGMPTGTLLISGADGVIMETGSDPTGYGNYLKILHDGFLTIYAHLKELRVKRGDRVVTGQLVGISDNTGNSTGPHLHFGVAPCDASGNKTEASNGYTGYIDPFGNRVTWEIKNISKPVEPSTQPTTPTTPANDVNAKKGTQVDKVLTFLKSKGYVPDDDSNKYLNGEFYDLIVRIFAELENNKARAGKWDKECLKAGITSDSNLVTVDQLYAAIDGKDVELQNNLNSIITDKNTQIASLSSQVESLRKDIQDKDSRLESLTEQAQKAVELTNELNQCKALSGKWTEKETSYLARIKTLETKLKNIKSPVKSLLVQILEKLS